jgi:carbonic anhydrase/acetyltransferase-like protein (isoleucine patch superfamily)
METEVLDFIGPGECDFALDLFPRLLEEKKKLFGYVDNDYWVDVGSLQGYLEGMHEVLKMYTGKKRNPSMNAIIGIDTDIQPGAVVDAAALIEEGVTVGEHSRIGPDAVLKEGVSISGRTFVVSSALFEGVRVGSTCHIQESIVGEKAVIGDRVTVEGSIIGPGASIEDGVQVKNGSRIWPGVVVSRGTVVEGTLALPFDRPFFFCLDVGRITGVTANTIGDLMTVLKHVDIRSIEFHLHRRDFERWIREVFHANSLAEEISKLRKEELHGDVLRARLLNAVEEWFNRSIESEPRTQST